MSAANKHAVSRMKGVNRPVNTFIYKFALTNVNLRTLIISILKIETDKNKMVSNHDASQCDQPIARKDTGEVIALLEANRKQILALWVETVREEFNESESTTDTQIADHMLYIIDALIVELDNFDKGLHGKKSYRQKDLLYNHGEIEDEQEGGELHGRQRAGINAYNAEKVHWEYVILRKIIVQFLQKHRQLDLDHLEIITSVIESCSRESLQTFTKTVQSVQRKLLGSIVHDIRSPLSIISMMSEVIAMGGDLERNLVLANKIVKATGSISEMLEGMLLVLSTEAGQGLELKFEKNNLNYVLSATALEVQALHGLRLKLNLPESNIVGVFDEAILKRVFENLISNAFKYGDSTTDVTITATETDKLIIIDVHNFGNPIDKVYWEDIFVFLKRFEGQAKIKHKSWGIGLAFVKAAVEGHGGKVVLSSDANSGTRFSIELPKYLFSPGHSTTVSI
ncbi:HAMP domain-containing sensor histidine kinase [Paraglaciecola sp.]|uniref:sensor histidine kinase n=1 Tax=Paraglaciecola sp. TaxID=1920173 RepID=UPI0030F3D5E5